MTREAGRAYVLLGFWHSYFSAGFVFAPLPSWRIHRATYVGVASLLMVLAAFVGLPAWHRWLTFTAWIRQI